MAKNELEALNFRKKVLKIYSDCLLHNKKAWRNYNSTLGNGKTNDFIYNTTALKKHSVEIINLLSQLQLSTENTKFQEMKKLKNGQQWTDLNLYTEILFSLANAINLMEFKQEKRYWDTKEKKDPTIKVNMKVK